MATKTVHKNTVFPQGSKDAATFGTVLTLPVTNFDLDLLMAARYAYYCLHRSLFDDQLYDLLEKEHTARTGQRLPVGSENKHDYTEAQRALAMYFLFSGRSVDTAQPKQPVPLQHGKKFF